MNNLPLLQADLIKLLPQGTNVATKGDTELFVDGFTIDEVPQDSKVSEDSKDTTESFWSEVSETSHKSRADKNTPVLEIKTTDVIEADMSITPAFIEPIIKTQAEMLLNGPIEHTIGLDVSESKTQKANHIGAASVASIPKEQVLFSQPVIQKGLEAVQNTSAANDTTNVDPINEAIAPNAPNAKETIALNLHQKTEGNLTDLEPRAEQSFKQIDDKAQYHAAHIDARTQNKSNPPSMPQSSTMEIAIAQGRQTVQLDPFQSAGLTSPLTTTSLSSNPTQTITYLNFAAPNNPNLKIINQAIIQARETTHGIQVQLDPPEMGRVMVDFIYEADQSMKVVIKAESLEAQIQLRQQSDILLASLKENGLENISLDFQMNSNDFRQSGENFMAEDEYFVAETPTETHPTSIFRASPDTGRLDLIL